MQGRKTARKQSQTTHQLQTLFCFFPRVDLLSDFLEVCNLYGELIQLYFFLAVGFVITLKSPQEPSHPTWPSPSVPFPSSSAGFHRAGPLPQPACCPSPSCLSLRRDLSPGGAALRSSQPSALSIPFLAPQEISVSPPTPEPDLIRTFPRFSWDLHVPSTPRGGGTHALRPGKQVSALLPRLPLGFAVLPGRHALPICSGNTDPTLQGSAGNASPPGGPWLSQPWGCCFHPSPTLQASPGCAGA